MFRDARWRWQLVCGWFDGDTSGWGEMRCTSCVAVVIIGEMVFPLKLFWMGRVEVVFDFW